jgi:hypothetical protein
MEELHTASMDGATRPAMELGQVPGRGRTPTSIYGGTVFLKAYYL